MSGSVEQRDAPWRRSQSNRLPPPTRDDVDRTSLVSSQFRLFSARLSIQGKCLDPHLAQSISSILHVFKPTTTKMVGE